MIGLKSAIKVSVDESSGVDRFLRKFKRLCDAYGIIREYRKRREYKKPSEKRLEKSLAAEKRRQKMLAKSARFRHRI